MPGCMFAGSHRKGIPFPGVVDDRFLNDLHDDFVRDETTRGDDTLRLHAEPRLLCNLLAKQIAGRDVEEIVLMNEVFRLSAFAGPRGTEESDIQHMRAFIEFQDLALNGDTCTSLNLHTRIT